MLSVIKYRPFLFLIAFFAFNVVVAQETDTLFLQNLLQQNSPLFDSILNAPDKKQVQILYTQINRDKHGKPHFQSYSYRLNDQHYFYPASTVKLAAAVFALEKINELAIPGLSSQSAMLTDRARAGQTTVTADTTAANGLPSVAHYIKKILLVSDNDAFNRLFEFVGRAEMNAKLKKYGLLHSRILNRLAIRDGGEKARYTNPIRFFNNGKLVYSQPMQYDDKDYSLPLSNTVMGNGYYDSSDHLVMQPFDLSNRNTFPLTDQQELMKRLLFPEVYPKNQRLNLTKEDRRLLLLYMHLYPTQSRFPRYDSTEFFSTYGKFLLYGAERQTLPMPYVSIYNKIGDSYGYMIDNAYIVDAKNKVEFLLAAVVQSNNDGIYNDDKYEYKEVCLPFLKNLGRVIYAYELKRKKKYLPKVWYKETDKLHTK